jgi:hypothetical protein
MPFVPPKLNNKGTNEIIATTALRNLSQPVTFTPAKKMAIQFGQIMKNMQKLNGRH